jgi:hypothetical protein
LLSRNDDDVSFPGNAAFNIHVPKDVKIILHPSPSFPNIYIGQWSFTLFSTKERQELIHCVCMYTQNETRRKFYFCFAARVTRLGDFGWLLTLERFF